MPIDIYSSLVFIYGKRIRPFWSYFRHRYITCSLLLLCRRHGFGKEKFICVYKILIHSSSFQEETLIMMSLEIFLSISVVARENQLLKNRPFLKYKCHKIKGA